MTARQIDASMREYRGLFRLRPVMPTQGNLDPKTLQRSFERLNEMFGNMFWEIEDLLPTGFVETFLDECPSALIGRKEVQGKVHWSLTKEGKARLHRFVRTHAVYDDLSAALVAIRSIRFLLNLPVR